MISQNGKNIGFFLNPKSIAIYGVSRRSGFSWGRFIFNQVIKRDFQGKIYPINTQAKEIEGYKAYPNIAAIPDEVELAVIALPVQTVLSTVQECIEKGVKGVVLITAGFSETHEGKDLEDDLRRVAKKSGIRILGPNVSGIFNLSAEFNASAAGTCKEDSPVAIICQGGFAIGNLISRGQLKGMGIGKYIHTGNECDLTCTDFLEYIGDDPSTKVILMYMEGLKEARRFFQVAKKVGQKKPIILAKLGITEAGSRAASSHTGALAGSELIFDAAFRQANIIRTPKLEILLELGYAFLELPPLWRNRIGILTIGGTWGVSITDALVMNGLSVPELSSDLQKRLNDLGMPYWASTKNPVDLGAAGRSLDWEGQLMVTETLLSSDEVDGVIIHGIGRFGFSQDGNLNDTLNPISEEEELLRKIYDLIPKYGKPLLVCNFFSEYESEPIQNLVKDRKRVYNDVGDAATILSSLYRYYSHLKKRIPDQSNSEKNAGCHL